MAKKTQIAEMLQFAKEHGFHAMPVLRAIHLHMPNGEVKTVSTWSELYAAIPAPF